MAKTKAAKETSLPVIVALVFFVLTTIGLGVFCYVLYSDQEAKDAAVAKANADMKNVRTGEKVAQQIALVHRLFTGLSEGDDAEKLAEIKEGDPAFQELKRLNDLAKKKAPEALKTAADKINAIAAKDPTAPKVDVATLAAPDELAVWAPEVDDKKQLKPPTGNLIDVAVRAIVLKNLAAKQTTAEQASYDAVLALIRGTSDEYKKAAKVFADASVKLPADFKAKMEALDKLADDRKKTYQDDVAKSRQDVDKLTGEKEDQAAKLRRSQDDAKRYKDDRDALVAKIDAKVDPLRFDEPQGKITKRLANNIVEIDLGATALVLPGLTFSVLPYDFPEKGRQSRVKVVRLPDERGNYKSVEQFTPKATLEVIEVLGPTLSRARLTSEDDDIRDAVLPGDLLYNAVWRKGQADHVALVGIFDINGDGTDDIESVVRDLRGMGVPVDAYYDLRTQKWIGRLTERTRYVVDGYTPTFTANDPNRDAKSKLISGMTTAKGEAKSKGITAVNFRDFFGKMGYRIRNDVSEDRINQAISRYLTGIGTTEAPPMEKN